MVPHSGKKRKFCLEFWWMGRWVTLGTCHQIWMFHCDFSRSWGYQRLFKKLIWKSHPAAMQVLHIDSIKSLDCSMYLAQGSFRILKIHDEWPFFLDFPVQNSLSRKFSPCLWRTCLPPWTPMCRIFADLVKGRRYHGQVSVCGFASKAKAKDECLIRDQLTPEN